MEIIAKFKVNDVNLTKNNEGKVTQEEVFASAVTSDSEENKAFATATPNASLTMTITNPNAFGFFIQGQEVLVKFEKAQ